VRYFSRADGATAMPLVDHLLSKLPGSDSCACSAQRFLSSLPGRRVTNRL
jgi:hypothetical protein